jgi:nicotinamide mononucleotide transporter
MIQLFGEQITFVELTGTVFGILGVWLTIRENILCFPTGIVNVALYAWLFYKSHLYADALLQIVYILLLIYGWYVWIHEKNYSELHVTKSSGNLLLFLFILCIISTIGIGTFFLYKTDASLPYMDSFTTSLSLVAQWMIAKKKIENWLVWIVADVLYVGMYVYKHLYFTSFLYFIFIILAVTGLQQWKKDLQPVSSVR